MHENTTKTRKRKNRLGGIHEVPSPVPRKAKPCSAKVGRFASNPPPHESHQNQRNSRKGGTGVEEWGSVNQISQRGKGRMWTHEKKPTANRRESRPSGSQNRICFSSLSLVGSNRPNGSSLIGSVRANPIAAPAAPVRGKEYFWLYFGVRGSDCGLPRRGGLNQASK